MALVQWISTNKTLIIQYFQVILSNYIELHRLIYLILLFLTPLK